MANLLLIEDDDLDREALARVVALRPDFQLRTAPSIDTALPHLPDADLVILDLGLPPLSGWDVWRALRAQWDGPTLIYSGQAEGRLARALVADGALGVIHKGLSTPEEVVGAIEVGTFRRASWTLLLVEDDAVDAYVVRRALRSVRAQIDHVETLDGAIEALSMRAFDVILLDVCLPDTSLDPLEGIRAIRRTAPQTPVVVWSTAADVELARDVALQGAVVLLEKSTARQDLAAQLVRASRHKPRSPLLQVNDAFWERMRQSTSRAEAVVRRIEGLS